MWAAELDLMMRRAVILDVRIENIYRRGDLEN